MVARIYVQEEGCIVSRENWLFGLLRMVVWIVLAVGEIGVIRCQVDVSSQAAL